MAINTLNLLFSVQSEISDIEKKLSELKEQEKNLTEKVLSSGSLENRYYRLISKVRAGNRIVQVHLLKEKYPDVAPKVITEAVKVTDLKRFLGDELISDISIKQADTVKYLVEKKEASPVVVA
jgi:predicted nuclease with TOPRIM domain